MPVTWQNALAAYNYPVCLHTYNNAGAYPGWFRFGPLDDRNTTMAFEDHFRRYSSVNIEAWLEVVYWKLFSQRGRSDLRTTAVANSIRTPPGVLQQLNDACADYMAKPSWTLLNKIRSTLGFRAPVVAVAATFPAFLNPCLFPMVDTRVARWAQAYGHAHNANDPRGPQLIMPRYPNNGRTVLTGQDYPFVESWTDWCRHTAAKLSAKSPMAWRARDVEMAVFTAWGKSLTLKPV
jgi:hypothetical protein